jgi:hypothetical protein
MTQHASLTLQRWLQFSIEQRILMIGNEMNRTLKRLEDLAPEPRRLGYERILRLTDLTLEAGVRPGLRRELLRWRGLAAALYVADVPDVRSHRAAFRALLQLHPAAASQIPVLLS